MTDFLPKGYKEPTSSNYMKFKEGDNTFRVLSPAITGYEYWNTSNKPVRSAMPFDEVPDDIKVDKDGKHKINYFWAFIVWNYEAEKIQILEITQKSIRAYMEGLNKNVKWGNPTGYDITVTRSGSGLETEYTTVASPHSKLDKAIVERYEKSNINLEALYDGADPFLKTPSDTPKVADTSMDYPPNDVDVKF